MTGYIFYLEIGSDKVKLIQGEEFIVRKDTDFVSYSFIELIYILVAQQTLSTNTANLGAFLSMIK